MRRVAFSRENAVKMFQFWLECPKEDVWFKAERAELLRRLPELRGFDLACWCALPSEGEPDLCHAAVLLRIANEEKS